MSNYKDKILRLLGSSDTNNIKLGLQLNLNQQLFPELIALQKTERILRADVTRNLVKLLSLHKTQVHRILNIIGFSIAYYQGSKIQLGFSPDNVNFWVKVNLGDES